MATEASTSVAGSGTLLLILIQVASRGFTFIGNQFLLRFLSPSLLGIAVQLDLVSVTSLYFARESLRVALQRQPPSSSSVPGKGGGGLQPVVNLSYLAVLLGFAISTVFGYSYLQGAADEVRSSPYFDTSFRIYAAATWVELLAEPAFVVIQQRALYRDRARAETTAALARCFVACLVAILGHRRGMAPSILPFAAGQAAFAVTLLGFYMLPTVRIAKLEQFSLVPRPLLLSSSSLASSQSDDSGLCHFNFFDRAILALATTMYMQSVFKLLLTQGDALIMSFLSSLADQGAFALASNYGGLLARLVFQPVEESSRNAFGRLLAPASTSTTDKESKDSKEETTSPGAATTTTTTNTNNAHGASKIQQSLTYLSTTLRIYLVFSRPLISLAPSLLPTLIPLLLSPQWRTSSTISLLQIYCIYIPLTAVNGILDAFVTSVASPSQLRMQSLTMLASTAAYALAAYAFMSVWHFGSVGLVGANMINMALRIAWGGWFLRSWVKERETETGAKGLWKGFVDAGGRVAAADAVAVIVGGFLMRSVGSSVLVDVRTGHLNGHALGMWTAGAVVVGSTILYTEGQFLLELLDSILPQRLASKIPTVLKRPSQKAKGS